MKFTKAPAATRKSFSNSSLKNDGPLICKKHGILQWRKREHCFYYMSDEYNGNDKPIWYALLWEDLFKLFPKKDHSVMLHKVARIIKGD